MCVTLSQEDTERVAWFLKAKGRENMMVTYKDGAGHTWSHSSERELFQDVAQWEREQEAKANEAAAKIIKQAQAATEWWNIAA